MKAKIVIFMSLFTAYQSHTIQIENTTDIPIKDLTIRYQAQTYPHFSDGIIPALFARSCCVGELPYEVYETKKSLLTANESCLITSENINNKTAYLTELGIGKIMQYNEFIEKARKDNISKIIFTYKPRLSISSLLTGIHIDQGILYIYVPAKESACLRNFDDLL
jgi:hypothetical protein